MDYVNTGIQIVAFTLGIIGAYENLRLKRRGFVWWGIAGILWVYIDISANLPIQAAMCVMYIILDVIAWFAWGKYGVHSY